MALHRRLFYLLLVLLPTQLGLHGWPSWSLVLGRRIDYLSPTLYVTDVLIGCILLSWIFARDSHPQKGFSFPLLRPVRYSIVVVVFAGINIWLALDRSVAAYMWMKVFEYVMLYRYITHTKPTWPFVLIPLSFGIWMSSLLAISQFMLQRSVGGVMWFLGERTFSGMTPGIARFPLCLPWESGCRLVLRAYATFPHPNVLGGYLAVMIPLLLSRVNSPHLHKRMRIYYGATMGVAAVALFFSGSRSAWVAVAFGIACVIGVGARWQHGHVSFGGTMRRIVPLLLLAAGFLGALLIFRPIPTDESVVERQHLNASAVSMWRAFPVFGVGLGNFLAALPSFSEYRSVQFLQPVHNAYLLVLSQVGLFGVAVMGYGAMIYAGVRRPRSIAALCSRQGVFVACIPLLQLLLLGFVDHYLLTLQQGQLLLIIIFALFSAQRI